MLLHGVLRVGYSSIYKVFEEYIHTLHPHAPNFICSIKLINWMIPISFSFYFLFINLLFSRGIQTCTKHTNMSKFLLGHNILNAKRSSVGLPPAIFHLLSTCEGPDLKISSLWYKWKIFNTLIVLDITIQILPENKKIRIIFHHNLGITFLQILKEKTKQRLNRLLFYM